jgi:DNA-binding FrmR family transcriptional regulator
VENKCACKRKKERSEAELRSLKNRLSRVEGQVRGVQKMLDEDAYCVDILTQVAAIRSALSAFSRELLGEHMKTCVANDIKAGREDAVEELLDTFFRLMK